MVLSDRSTSSKLSSSPFRGRASEKVNAKIHRDVKIDVDKRIRKDVDIDKTVRQDVYLHRDRRDRDDHHRRYGGHHDHDNDLDIDIDIDFSFGHRHHGYRYRHWPYYRWPYYYRPRVVYRPTTVVYTPPVVVVHDSYPVIYKTYVECNGWGLLARGEAYEALQVFEKQTYTYPDAGLPRAGMALARAMLGDDYAAAEDMRYAFQRDPEALKYLPLPEKLDYRLHELISHFERKKEYEPLNRDWRFMLATLNYFRHDFSRAEYELSYLLDYDDPGYAVKNLNAILYEIRYGDYD